MNSSKHEKTQKKFGLSWHFYVACIVIAIVAIALSFHFSRIEEYAYEMADLELMRNAEDTAILMWHGKLPNAPMQYWFLPGELRLIPDTESIPLHCGMGTKKSGGAVKAFSAKSGKTFDYVESEDYTDKAVHVIVSSVNGFLHIQVDWVRCE